MAHWLACIVANKLQAFYEAHRVPETWGTPTVSPFVFETLRTKGFWAARADLNQRLQKVGLPKLSTWEKCMALVFGVMIVALANTLLKGEEKPIITRREVRRFSPHAPKFLVALYTLGAALLVAANEGGGGRENYNSSDEEGREYRRNPDGSFSLHYPGSESSTEYRAYTQPNSGDGGQEADPEFLDEFDTDRDSRGGFSNN